MLVNQIVTLTRKNLIILAVRRPLSSAFRVLLFPLAVVLILAYSKWFLSTPEHYGIGKDLPVLSLEDALRSSQRSHVAFYDNGMKNGEIAAVIDSISKTINATGKIASIVESGSDLGFLCKTNRKGITPCFAAVEFHSSPSEPANGGFWSYTIYDDSTLGKRIDVTKNSDPQIYVLPLQRHLDAVIKNPTNPSIPKTIQRAFNGEPEDLRQKAVTAGYLNFIITIVGVLFFFAMIGITFHMPGPIAQERELGMSQLIDAMMSTSSPWKSQFARLSSAYISFAALYFPGWLAVGIVFSILVFPISSGAISVLYHLLSGLALASYSMVGAVLFRRAQLSGVLVAVVALVLAVVPQVVSPRDQKTSMVLALAFLFPSANYTYWVILMARFEFGQRKANLLQDPPYHPSAFWQVKGYLLFVFLVIQIFLYPAIAGVLERLLYGTRSTGRKVIPQMEVSGSATVQLRDLTKVYKGFFRKKQVQAVSSLTFDARQGEILTLLGPNGSGKSTTLNCISGMLDISDGSIEIRSTGGLGVAPQGNVMWSQLTVEEHIRVFCSLKATSKSNIQEETEKLIEACDLPHKRKAQAGTLSGGQKRKLQLAMMFAGGSAVCCVDEVSSGLDPLSRRKVWDILLAERKKRTIIMTTHFLDEAEFLADQMVIMSKGQLAAEGSVAELKQRLGNGYTIHVTGDANSLPPASEHVKRETFNNNTTYRVTDPAYIPGFIRELDEAGISEYNISGPTIEELFLKIAGEPEQSPAREDVDNSHEPQQASAHGINKPLDLEKARPISALRQFQILLGKRFRVVRRRYMPYVAAVVITLAAAGVSPLILKDAAEHAVCPEMQPPVDYDNFQTHEYTPGNVYPIQMLAGPRSKLKEDAWEIIADIYSNNRSENPLAGFRSVDEAKASIQVVDTLDEFNDYLKQNNYSVYPGGFFLSDPPLMVAEPWMWSGLVVQNLLSIFTDNIPIVSGWESFMQGADGIPYDFRSLMFLFYFGLIWVVCPAFFVLYPTSERLNNLRAMQYSNGVRPLPLWLSHLAFDTVFILFSSGASVGLFYVVPAVWYAAPILWVVLFLYGIASTLLGYVLSLFAPSPLAAWAFSAFGQLIMYMAMYGGTLGVSVNAEFSKISAQLDKLYFGLASVSPAGSLFRALYTAMGQFSQPCRGITNPVDLRFYGGPILYLVLQIFFLFLFIIWWDGSSTYSFTRLFHRRRPTGRTDALESSEDIELVRSTTNHQGLTVHSLSKNYSGTPVLQDVSFTVPPSTTFALLGPNGAGKSTTISLIRGEIQPSNATSEISIAGVSPLSHRSLARSKLGVCPQYNFVDALTVHETLIFYARIRGVRDPGANVRVVMEACGLTPYAHRYLAALSGGTQRKLSLAIALLGNPAVLLLDEPSSGLDAAAKRTLWRTLQSVSVGRAIVLTTHSMEEAEAVCSTVGILSGKMLAIGSREEIKRQGGGEGVLVHLEAGTGHYMDVDEARRLREYVEEVFPGAVIEREVAAGQVRFRLDKHKGSEIGMGRLFELLERTKQELGLVSYSVGRPTLDEVFVEIVTRHGGREENYYGKAGRRWRFWKK